MRTQQTAPVRTAVVTGASSGIGARAVERLRARGAQVVVTDVNDALVARYEGDDQVFPVVGDITREGFAATVMEEARTRFGRIDRVIHCAGIMPGGAIRETTAATAAKVMDVNYLGTVRMIEAALPVLRAQGSAQLVVLGSLTGYVPTQRFGAYSASKAAVNTYVETLGREERKSGVQVLLVAPTAVKTPLLKQASDGPGFVQRLAKSSSKKSPLMISPDDVLDVMDSGLARRRSVVIPGGRATYLLRRISPRLSWAVTDLVGG